MDEYASGWIEGSNWYFVQKSSVLHIVIYITEMHTLVNLRIPKPFEMHTLIHCHTNFIRCSGRWDGLVKQPAHL